MLLSFGILKPSCIISPSPEQEGVLPAPAHPSAGHRRPFRLGPTARSTGLVGECGRALSEHRGGGRAAHPGTRVSPVCRPIGVYCWPSRSTEAATAPITTYGRVWLVMRPASGSRSRPLGFHARWPQQELRGRHKGERRWCASLTKYARATESTSSTTIVCRSMVL